MAPSRDGDAPVNLAAHVGYAGDGVIVSSTARPTNAGYHPTSRLIRLCAFPREDMSGFVLTRTATSPLDPEGNDS